MDKNSSTPQPENTTRRHCAGTLLAFLARIGWIVQPTAIKGRLCPRVLIRAGGRP